MPQTDSFSQGVTYPSLTDGPKNIQTAFAGVVDPLTSRSTMRFPSASVRNAQIQTPVAGMRSYLQDQRIEQYFDGVTWQTVVASSLPWANVTLASGYQPWGGSTVAPRVRREGSIVYLEGRLTGAGSGGAGATIPARSNVVIGTIPTAYQPVEHYAEGFVSINADQTQPPVARIEIWPSNAQTNPGTIRYWSPIATSLIGFSSWWFVN